MKLSNKPIIPAPEPIYNFVELPFGSSLDFTPKIVKYSDREFDLTFTITDKDAKIYSEKLINEVHGNKFKISFTYDPMFFYIGRVKVDEVEESEKGNHIILKLSFITEPYKYKKYETVHKVVLKANEEKEITIRNSKMIVNPIFDTEKDIFVNGFTVNKNKNEDVFLYEGNNTLEILSKEDAIVFINYQEGEL